MFRLFGPFDWIALHSHHERSFCLGTPLHSFGSALFLGFLRLFLFFCFSLFAQFNCFDLWLTNRLHLAMVGAKLHCHLRFSFYAFTNLAIRVIYIFHFYFVRLPHTHSNTTTVPLARTHNRNGAHTFVACLPLFWWFLLLTTTMYNIYIRSLFFSALKFVKNRRLLWNSNGTNYEVTLILIYGASDGRKLI